LTLKTVSLLEKERDNKIPSFLRRGLRGGSDVECIVRDDAV